MVYNMQYHNYVYNIFSMEWKVLQSKSVFSNYVKLRFTLLKKMIEMKMIKMNEKSWHR